MDGLFPETSRSSLNLRVAVARFAGSRSIADSLQVLNTDLRSASTFLGQLRTSAGLQQIFNDATENILAEIGRGPPSTRGNGVRRDTTEVLASYKREAEAGDMCAVTCLGQRHRHGLGVDQDLESAFTYFERAVSCEEDFSMKDYATVELAIMYRLGLFQEADEKKAEELFRIVEGRMSSSVLTEVGKAYVRGVGCTKDARVARHLFKRAGVLGNSEACCELGLLCRDGKGGEKNEALALELFELSHALRSHA